MNRGKRACHLLWVDFNTVSATKNTKKASLSVVLGYLCFSLTNAVRNGGTAKRLC